MTTAPPATTTATLETDGATIHHEVRGEGPLVVLVGSPMHADHFAPLAERLAPDHTVVTLDPRGIRHSTLADPDQDSFPEQRADDLSRLIAHLGRGPAVVVGSSGGAVTGLALLAAHPEQVTTLVAHEPPLTEVTEDADERRARTDRNIATYLREGPEAAWLEFLADANIDPGPVPDGAPPERDPQEVADERFFFVHELRPTTTFRPDLDALRAVADRLVVAIGDDSTGQACDVTSRALAAAVGVPPTAFPGDHIAFLTDPDPFAARLRSVLDPRCG